MHHPCDPCLYGCRLHIIPVCAGNRHTPRDYGRRKYHCNQRFRIRPGLAHREDRYHRFVDKPGQCSSPHRFRHRFARTVLFRLAPERCLVLIHVHSGWNVLLPLYDSPVHERNYYRAVSDHGLFLRPHHDLRSPRCPLVRDDHVPLSCNNGNTGYSRVEGALQHPLQMAYEDGCGYYFFCSNPRNTGYPAILFLIRMQSVS